MIFIIMYFIFFGFFLLYVIRKKRNLIYIFILINEIYVGEVNVGFYSLYKFFLKLDLIFWMCWYFEFGVYYFVWSIMKDDFVNSDSICSIWVGVDIVICNINYILYW